MSAADRLELDSASPVASGRGAGASVLFGSSQVDLSSTGEPSCFGDLNLDQLVEAVVTGREEYELTPFFHAPLRDVDDVQFRHEVFRDLDGDDVRAAVEAFAEGALNVHRYLTLAKKQHYKYEKERWLLDAAAGYCRSVSALWEALAGLELGSRGLRAWRDWLIAYTGPSTSARSRRTPATCSRDWERFATRCGSKGCASPSAPTRTSPTTASRSRRPSRASVRGRWTHTSSKSRTRARWTTSRRRSRSASPACTRTSSGRSTSSSRRHRGLLRRGGRPLRARGAVLPRLARVHRDGSAPAGLAFCYPEVSADSKEVLAERAVRCSRWPRSSCANGGSRWSATTSRSPARSGSSS